jgi:hypothetical protein
VFNKITLPFLLRPIKQNGEPNSSEYILASELCDLSLVVPCYNEESRLPAMMQSHLAYIKR